MQEDHPGALPNLLVHKRAPALLTAAAAYTRLPDIPVGYPRAIVFSPTTTTSPHSHDHWHPPHYADEPPLQVIGQGSSTAALDC